MTSDPSSNPPEQAKAPSHNFVETNSVSENIPQKHNRLTQKLIHLYGLLDQLGWLIASEDPNASNTFILRDRTQKRIGKSSISRKELEDYLEALEDKAFLHQTPNLVIWREIQKITSQSAPFTKREREIYEHLLSGQAVPAIAKDLGISQRTVEKHVERIYKKRGVNSYNELLFSHSIQRSKTT
ncbi:LuxR C-terminal-related transcriptional regulator [Puniceicoccaceae bacterium K14]|nr:LuxR C-terminal-related transcriptional regulator [Puniceicoccaceae bacterium K14]